MSLPCNVFTGSLRPFPAEHPWFSEVQRQVLDDTAHLGLFPEESPHGDFEDFWEDAFRASAAVRACMDTGVPLRLAAEGEVPDTAVRLGPVSVAEEGAHAVDTLLIPDALREYGYRLMTRAWVDMSADTVRGVHDPSAEFESRGVALADNECPEDFYGALLWMWHRGVPEVVVKSAHRKTGVSRIRTAPDLETLRSRTSADYLLCWTTTPDAAPMAGFLIQEWVPMTYEYRFFIVDGRTVTGAGCVEEFTPLNRLGDTFDPQMRAHRGNGIASVTDSRVEECPVLAQRYLDFIAPIASELPEGMNTVVVDVALDARTDTPLIVEFNTLPNSGLYASDVHAVYRALVGADNRGYIT